MEMSSGMLKMSGAMVSGIVSGVSGSTISLAGGTIVVDATGATITGDRQKNLTLASIQTGAQVTAMLKTADVAAGAPMPASAIIVMDRSDVMLSGPVQSVDAANKTFSVLGRTISVTADTSFGGGMGHMSATTFSDLAAGVYVGVSANVVSGKLVADNVMVMALTPQPQTTFFRATVKSIAVDTWVITTERGDVTLLVNAQTKIVGTPKVGDAVDVVARVDSSNAYVALSIMPSRSGGGSPGGMVTFSGTVKSIAATSWVISEANKDTTVVVNERTKISSGTKVGDRVMVVADGSSGTLVALSIMRSMM